MRPIPILSSIVLFAATLLAAGSAPAQSQTPPSPENLAAARELVQVVHTADNFAKMLPTILQNLKASVVQNRPEVEKQYDSMIPIFTQKAQNRINQFAESVAAIYASNFTADELHDLIAFYRTPTGQKLIARQPAIPQQIFAMGLRLEQEISTDIQRDLAVQANDDKVRQGH